MAFIDAICPLEWPAQPAIHFNANNPNGTSMTMDATTDYVGYIFECPKTGTLEGVHIMMTQQTTIEDIRISFMDVDSNGDPDGTEDEFRVITPVGGDLNTHRFSGIVSSDGTDVGTKRSVTKGDFVAIQIRFNSTGGDIDFSRGHTKPSGWEAAPYTVFSTNSGTSWAKTQSMCNIAIEYDDGIECSPYCFPYISTDTPSLSESTNPDEIGLKFQVPIDMTVDGVIVAGVTTGVTVSIENASATTLGTAKTYVFTDTGAGSKRVWVFATAVTLSANTDYYVVWTPDASSRSFKRFTLASAGMRAAWPFGTNLSWNERENGGSWTETTDEIAPLSLRVATIQDGAVAAGDSFLPQIQMAGSHGPIPVY